jgi:hypothetical protein
MLKRNGSTERYDEDGQGSVRNDRRAERQDAAGGRSATFLAER